MTQRNVELARGGYKAALRGDFDAIAALLDDDVKWHAGDPTAEGACRNREETLAFMQRARERGPLGELLDVIDAGNKVVVIMRPAFNGTAEPAPSANVSTFRDGKVVEMVHYPDPRDALAAVDLDL